MKKVARRTVLGAVLIMLAGMLAITSAATAANKKPALSTRPSTVSIPEEAVALQSESADKAAPKEPAEAQVNWRVLAGGGGSGTAGTLHFSATIGQPIVGWTGTTGQNVHAGFWQDFGSGSCCEFRGNVDHQYSGGNPIVITDITYLIALVFRAGPAAPCPEEADATADGNINVADITYLIAYVFRGGPAPPPC